MTSSKYHYEKVTQYNCWLLTSKFFGTEFEQKLRNLAAREQHKKLFFLSPMNAYIDFHFLPAEKMLGTNVRFISFLRIDIVLKYTKLPFKCLRSYL